MEVENIGVVGHRSQKMIEGNGLAEPTGVGDVITHHLAFPLEDRATLREELETFGEHRSILGVVRMARRGHIGDDRKIRLHHRAPGAIGERNHDKDAIVRVLTVEHSQI